MIAAIYARKSTEQHGVDAEARSVATQTSKARACTGPLGWTVAEDHVYGDDGISGADPRKLKSRQRLIAVIESGRAPFQVLIMRDPSRFSRRDGDEAFGELKRIAQAGILIWFYQDGRAFEYGELHSNVRGILDAEFAADYRRKASKNTHEAMIRKAERGHVTGGRCFGYDNVCSGCGALIAPGKVRCCREGHTIRRINEAEAVVVRTIFRLSAEGLGVHRIGKRLNAEGAPAPRPQAGRPSGWSPATVTTVLKRDLYRGIVVYNQTRRRGPDGAGTFAKRAEAEVVRVPCPELRIVSDLDWQKTHARLDTVVERISTPKRKAYFQNPRRRDRDSPYLLPGFTRCVTCGGPIGVLGRLKYGCITYHLRGPKACTNRVRVPVAAFDAAVVEKITNALTPAMVDLYVDGVLAAVAPEQFTATLAARRREVEGLDREIANLVKAIAVTGDLDLVEGLKDRKGRREDLTRAIGAAAPVDLSRYTRRALRAQARAEFDAWREALDTVPAGRALLRKIIVGRIVVEPQGGALTFRGDLTIGEIFGEIPLQVSDRPGRHGGLLGVVAFAGAVAA